MDEQTKTIAKLAGIIAGVILLVLAAFRYFGGTGPSGVDGTTAADDGSPYVIRSAPPHAQVYINNELAGRTPFRYKSFDPGVLRIRLEHENLAPVETLLIVQEDDPVPAFPTFVFSIPVELTSNPPGAQPVVNGRVLRPYEIASYAVPATETLQVVYELGGEVSKPVQFNPVTGIVGDVDSLRWQWRPATEEDPAQLTGIFAKLVRVSSEPPGAAIYLDGNPIAIGRTNSRVAIPYGEHTLTLRMPPFEDKTVLIAAGRDRSEPISIVMRRVVWLSAVDRINPYDDLNASIKWVSQGGHYVVNPDDRMVTPASVVLEGIPSLVQVTCAGYADTIVSLGAFASELHVEMRPAARVETVVERGKDTEVSWVRFVVKEGRRNLIAGAEVFGVDKYDGRIVRYGPTNADGELTTRVPVGDYDWWAAKEGFAAGKPNGERVKLNRKTKEITLKLKPL